ncbi:heavy metal translocating P-type ATPase [Candidatus Woesearchaeota archaeon]|nr:heavy metal translocating P-type ATPase [Candidatus Woesearchaeota archaeon]
MTNKKEKDPICGMEVDPDTAKFELFVKDKTYYFCSEHCLNEFQRQEHPVELKQSAKKKLGIEDEKNPKQEKMVKKSRKTGMFEVKAPEEMKEEKEEKKGLVGKVFDKITKKGEEEQVLDEKVVQEAVEEDKKEKGKEVEEKGVNVKTDVQKSKKGLDTVLPSAKKTIDKEEKEEKAGGKKEKKAEAKEEKEEPEKEEAGEEKKPEGEKEEKEEKARAEDKSEPEKEEEKKPVEKKGVVKDTLLIEGMTCSSCVATIEKSVKKVKGVKDVAVNFASEKAVVSYDADKVQKSAIEDAIFEAGYKVLQEKPKPVDTDAVKQKDARDMSKLKVVFAMIIAVPLLYLGMAMHFNLPTFMGDKTLAAVELILAFSIMIIGYQFYTRGVWAVVKTRKANMDTLVAVGTTAAFMYSLAVSVMIWKGDMLFGAGNLYYEVAGVLVAVILLGRHMETATKGRVSEAVKKLVELQPNEAFVLRGKEEYRVRIDELKKGDIVIVEPGGRIPVDGVVVSGQSDVDESIVTGEPMPVVKKKGSKVTSGTINKTGVLRFKATKVGKDTFLSQVIKLVEEAQGSKAPIQRFADRVASYFVPAVIGIAIISFVFWLLLSQQVGFPLLVFVAVLIIACPCALGLATPTAVMMGIGMAADRGILIKNAETLQKTRDIDVVVFDKTGTITAGKPELTNYIGIGKFPKEAVLQYAAIVEKHSEHPIAKAIVDEAAGQKMSMPDATHFKAHPGHGVEGVHSSKKILFGNVAFVQKKGIKLTDAHDKIEYYEKQGKTVMVLAVDKKVAGVVAVADTIKENAVAAVEELKKAGKEVILMTGDNKKTAEAVARQAGIDSVISQVLPEEKEKKVAELQAKGKKVAMVGDGINDAPALSKADLGIAVGSGTDVAIESADIILVRNDLQDIMRAFRISSYTLKKIKQNLFWALLYNSIGIPIAAGVLYPFTGWLLNPMIAGVAMGLSSISVVGNSLLMKGYKV